MQPLQQQKRNKTTETTKLPEHHGYSFFLSHFSFLATFDKGYKMVLGPDSPLLNLPLLPTWKRYPEQA
jgi:hypothetical protein